MRVTEIFELNRELDNIWIHPNYLQKYSYGKEWSDIPFPNLRTVDYHTYDTWTGNEKPDRVLKYQTEPRFGLSGEMELLIFEETPENDLTWKELLILVDKLVGRSGDKHHDHFEGFELSNGRLNILTGS